MIADFHVAAHHVALTVDLALPVDLGVLVDLAVPARHVLVELGVAILTRC